MNRGFVVALVLASAAVSAEPLRAQDPEPIPHALWLDVVDSVAPPGPVVAVPLPLCTAYETDCGAEAPTLSGFGRWGGAAPERVHEVVPTGPTLRARLDALGCGAGTACSVAALGAVREHSRDAVVLTLELQRIASVADRLMDVTGYEVTVRWVDGAWRVASVRVTRRS